jgi:hypothetical protein
MMESFGRSVFRLSIPLNLLLIVWVWLGRGMFGVPWGWMFLILLFTAVPVLLILLGITTVLAFRQPDRRLTPRQAYAQVAIWVAMLVFGAAIADFDDSGHTESVLSHWFGPGLLDAGQAIVTAAVVVAAVAWIALLALLIAGRRPKTSAP